METELIICSPGEKDIIDLLRYYGVDLDEVIEKTLPKLGLAKNQPNNNCTADSPNLICSKCGRPVNIGLINNQVDKNLMLCRTCLIKSKSS
ncbi:hypothetical protein SAMN05660649_05087 [Desulfotomaculum arcticum]|uniref:Uncharacterized protein n=1 Tax=Desulfotruncus arcticus DSM 17038 TaxID=1121424 RepID=A0A1I2ZSC1_9FIRM|nr:hypothetical protein [Desulfotruncus arcticus]SFH40409.1 hypothetical protein SAMN05660649_05087 [Desulfotomaculum arcticum] [Desulfotruncus arcticus DSM 17038]